MTTASTTHRPIALLVRMAVVPSVVAGLLCAAVAAGVAGSDAMWGALLGTLLVTGFFWFGQVVLHTLRTIAPGLFLVVGLLTYTLQVVALLAVFASFRRGEGWAEHVSGTALGVTVIVCTAIWTVGLVVASHFSRVPLYDASGRA